MSVEDEPSPSTYRDHLLSHSLVRELFRHNLVRADGRMKDDPADLNRYRSSLKRMYAERTAALYEKRNQLVSQAENILKSRSPRPSEERRLKAILDELELESTDGEIPIPKEPLKVSRRYLGSSEPKQSVYERQLLEDIQRHKVLKRDLRVLDDWLKKLSAPVAKVSQIRRIPSLTWKEFQEKHNERVKKRIAEMDQARHSLVKDFNSFNENIIRKLVASRNSVERHRIYRSSRDLPVDARVPKSAQSDSRNSVERQRIYRSSRDLPVDARVPKSSQSDSRNSVERHRIYRSSRDLPVDARVPKSAQSDTSTFVPASSTTPEDGDNSSKRRPESSTSVPDLQSPDTTEDTGTSEEGRNLDVTSNGEKGTSEGSILSSKLRTSKKTSQNES